MGVTIEADRWRITGDSVADLRAGIAAVREELVAGDTVIPPQRSAEAPLDAYAGLQGRRQRPTVRLRSQAAAMTVTRETAAEILRKLKESGRDGLDRESFRGHFGAAGSCALGNELERVADHLRSSGLTETDCLVRAGKRNGSRYRQGPRIADAIQAMG